jgi:hypothetical protein
MSHRETTTTTTTSIGQVPHLHCDEAAAKDLAPHKHNTVAMNSDHQHKYATNDAHLGATTARDGETLSAGSTARNESATRMMDNGGALEKDFSRQARMYSCLS